MVQWSKRSLHFECLPILVEVIKFPIFPQIQKSPKHPGGGGGQENYGLFPYFVTFFNLKAPLKKNLLNWQIYIKPKRLFPYSQKNLKFSSLFKKWFVEVNQAI